MLRPRLREPRAREAVERARPQAQSKAGSSRVLGARSALPRLHDEMIGRDYENRRRKCHNTPIAPSSASTMLDGSGTTVKRLVPLAESRDVNEKENCD